MARTLGLNSNLAAFLDMLAHSEGTSTIAASDDGYNVLVGGSLFSDYSDHPRKLVSLHAGLKSTAAGRYQILERNYDFYKQKLGLSNFDPLNQDAIAIQMVKEARAYNLILSGQFAAAVQACAHLWASLPGAGYGQHENTIASLSDVYSAAGGILTQA